MFWQQWWKILVQQSKCQATNLSCRDKNWPQTKPWIYHYIEPYIFCSNKLLLKWFLRITIEKDGMWDWISDHWIWDSKISSIVINKNTWIVISSLNMLTQGAEIVRTTVTTSSKWFVSGLPKNLRYFENKSNETEIGYSASVTTCCAESDLSMRTEQGILAEKPDNDYNECIIRFRWWMLFIPSERNDLVKYNENRFCANGTSMECIVFRLKGKKAFLSV